jgi:hypothetical protein
MPTKTIHDRYLAWADERSSRRYENSVLSPEFDEGDEDPVDSYERLVFGSFDGDMKGRPEKGKSGVRICDARRKRRTVSTDAPETYRLPVAPPPGWAKP